jgi:hypothetical protein
MISAAPGTRWLAALAASTAFSCTPLVPVAHDPWVEDRTLELSRERLVLEVGPRAVDVEARFGFTERGKAREHAMTFAIAHADGPPVAFLAELVARDGRVTPLGCTATMRRDLPVRGVAETRDFVTPSGAFASGAWLRVRYSQPATRRFAYVLRTGAFWAGPIHELDVVLRDRLARVVSATVEGRSADRVDAAERTWHFVDLEPREAIELTLR